LGIGEKQFERMDSAREDRDNRSPPWLREVDVWFAAEVFPHEASLVRMAHRITGDEETAREIVHEIYAELLRGDRWRLISRPRAYAVTAVRRAAFRLMQRARVVPIKTFADMDVVVGRDLSPDAHQLLFAKEQRRILLEIIDRLPPRCREVVRLRRIEEKSPQAIARELGITVSAVDKHLARGMALITEGLTAIADRPGEPLRRP